MANKYQKKDVCRVCGKEFTYMAKPGNYRITCSEFCRRRMQGITQANVDGFHATDPDPIRRSAPATQQNRAVNRVNARAREHHMSYGAYVAAYREYKRTGVLVLGCKSCGTPYRRRSPNTYRRSCPCCGSDAKTIIDEEAMPKK